MIEIYAICQKHFFWDCEKIAIELIGIVIEIVIGIMFDSNNDCLTCLWALMRAEALMELMRAMD
jgi:hypothetical protein